VQKEINKANALFKHIAILVPAVAKSFHAKADGRKKKYDRTTLCISNSGLSAILKRKTLNQRSVLSDSLVA
jgi:hypothetical protein